MGRLPLSLDAWIIDQPLCDAFERQHVRLSSVRDGITGEALRELENAVRTFMTGGASLRNTHEWKRSIALYHLGARLVLCVDALVLNGIDPDPLIAHMAAAGDDKDRLHDEAQMHCWAQLAVGASTGALRGLIAAVPAEQKVPLPDLRVDRIGVEVKIRPEGGVISDREKALLVLRDGIKHAADKAGRYDRVVAYVDLGPLDLLNDGQSRDRFSDQFAWFDSKLDEIFRLPEYGANVPALILITWGAEIDQENLQITPWFKKHVHWNRHVRKPMPAAQRALVEAVFNLHTR